MATWDSTGGYMTAAGKRQFPVSGKESLEYQESLAMSAALDNKAQSSLDEREVLAKFGGWRNYNAWWASLPQGQKPTNYAQVKAMIGEGPAPEPMAAGPAAGDVPGVADWPMPYAPEPTQADPFQPPPEAPQVPSAAPTEADVPGAGDWPMPYAQETRPPPMAGDIPGASDWPAPYAETPQPPPAAGAIPGASDWPMPYTQETPFPGEGPGGMNPMGAGGSSAWGETISTQPGELGEPGFTPGVTQLPPEMGFGGMSLEGGSAYGTSASQMGEPGFTPMDPAGVAGALGAFDWSAQPASDPLQFEDIAMAENPVLKQVAADSLSQPQNAVMPQILSEQTAPGQMSMLPGGYYSDEAEPNPLFPPFGREPQPPPSMGPGNVPYASVAGQPFTPGMSAQFGRDIAARPQMGGGVDGTWPMGAAMPQLQAQAQPQSGGYVPHGGVAGQPFTQGMFDQPPVPPGGFYPETPQSPLYPPFSQGDSFTKKDASRRFQAAAAKLNQ